MDPAIIVALLSLVGTMVGSLLGVLASNKLTNYRIEQLEKKADKHNTVIERTALLEEQMKVSNHRISDLEESDRA